MTDQMGAACPRCALYLSVRGCAPERCANPEGAAELERLRAAETDLARLRMLDLMRELSETYWCADWEGNLDRKLAEVLTRGKPGPCGLADIEPEDFERLRRLHAEAGGWWRWDASAEKLLYQRGIPVRFVPDAKL